MGFNYNCDFNLQDCMKTLGVNERGRVQQVVTDEVYKSRRHTLQKAGR